MMRISIIGAGYVGLVTGACLADRGHAVTCVDLDAARVDAINRGRSPIHEPGLDAVLARTAGTRLKASTDLARAVADSELTFIAVGTPAVDGRIDLHYVLAAAEQIGAALRARASRHTVVIKSTVIPGTTDGAVRTALERVSGKEAGRDFGLGMNPEFLTEGRAVRDFMEPDRIVLGGIDGATHAALAGVYAGFEGVRVIRTNNGTAEMIKYASNATLAAMISLANEFSRLCARLPGVDVANVTRGVHESLYFTTRGAAVGEVRAAIASFLEAGCGFGGSCLPKDVTALVAQGRDLGLDMPLLRAVLEINATQPDEVMRLIDRHHADLGGVPVTVLGIAFKPDTDDVRESPAFPVIARLRAAGARITAYDPVARPAQDPRLAGVRIVESLGAAVAGAQVVILVTRWAEFESLPDLLRDADPQPLVVDGRRMLAADSVARYEGIGR
jgi:UDPglucose 6-dehydrogenase